MCVNMSLNIDVTMDVNMFVDMVGNMGGNIVLSHSLIQFSYHFQPFSSTPLKENYMS